MNYLEPILEFLYRIVRLVFGRKQKKERPQPPCNPDTGTDSPQPPVPSDEPAGGDDDGSRGHPDPLPPQSSTGGQSSVSQNNTGQTAVNISGWCLIVAGGIAKLIG